MLGLCSWGRLRGISSLPINTRREGTKRTQPGSAQRGHSREHSRSLCPSGTTAALCGAAAPAEAARRLWVPMGPALRWAALPGQRDPEVPPTS